MIDGWIINGPGRAKWHHLKGDRIICSKNPVTRPQNEIHDRPGEGDVCSTCKNEKSNRDEEKEYDDE